MVRTVCLPSLEGCRNDTEVSPNDSAGRLVDLGTALLTSASSAGRQRAHLSYKSAFVFPQKLREAIAEEMKGRVVGG
jgi:hypothetical protein